MIYRCIALALCIGLTACATPNRRVAVNPALLAELQLREQALGEQDFSLSGRIALSNGVDGGSGRFAWQQRGAALKFSLSAPLSNQTWNLDGQPGAFRLVDSAGRVREAADAQQLVLEVSNWTIPVAELKYWARGMRAPGGPAIPQFDGNGRLLSLAQSGWLIEYAAWGAGNPALPLKLKLSRDSATVKVVVKQWQP